VLTEKIGSTFSEKREGGHARYLLTREKKVTVLSHLKEGGRGNAFAAEKLGRKKREKESLNFCTGEKRAQKKKRAKN